MVGNNKLLPSDVPMTKEDECRGKQSAEDKMAEMIGRLKLTSEESDALEVADDVEDGLATSNCAIIGKVVSQGRLTYSNNYVCTEACVGKSKGVECEDSWE